MKILVPLLVATLSTPLGAMAQSNPPAAQTRGTVVVVPAYGEVTRANDEARATFTVEEQDKDKAAAASRANQKMREGMEIVRREDPKARLKTQGYYTYPVYAEAPPQARSRPIVGWRVGQSLEVTTTNLSGLPKMTAAAQRVLGLNGLGFGLSNETLRVIDQQRIAAAYRHMNERIASVALAMGRDPSEATVESVELEGATEPVRPLAAMRAAAAPQAEAAAVAEPSFEPGETTLQMRIVGKVRFR